MRPLASTPWARESRDQELCEELRDVIKANGFVASQWRYQQEQREKLEQERIAEGHQKLYDLADEMYAVACRYGFVERQSNVNVRMDVDYSTSSLKVFGEDAMPAPKSPVWKARKQNDAGGRDHSPLGQPMPDPFEDHSPPTPSPEESGAVTSEKPSLEKSGAVTDSQVVQPGDVAASSSAATSALSGSGAVTDSQVAQPSAVAASLSSWRRWSTEQLWLGSYDAVRSYDRLNFKCPDARIANRASI
jgi:hypothetical protein